jgi:hypothetical protein
MKTAAMKLTLESLNGEMKKRQREDRRRIQAHQSVTRTEGSLERLAAASKPPRARYTGNWLKCCDRCEHAEPHYCRLYSRTMKNMDCKTCSSWQERQNKKVSDAP